jgi:hypothetical protein
MYWTAVVIGTAMGMLRDPVVWIALCITLGVGLMGKSWLWVPVIAVVLRAAILLMLFSWHESLGVTNADRLETLLRTSIAFTLMASIVWGIGHFIRSKVPSAQPGD